MSSSRISIRAREQIAHENVRRLWGFSTIVGIDINVSKLAYLVAL